MGTTGPFQCRKNGLYLSSWTRYLKSDFSFMNLKKSPFINDIAKEPIYGPPKALNNALSYKELSTESPAKIG